jgi:soluble cytochrome b562
MSTNETTSHHDSVRDQIGQAINDAIASGAPQADYCDSREIDRLADAVLAVVLPLLTDRDQRLATMTSAWTVGRKLLAAWQRGEVPPADPAMPYYVDQAWLDAAPVENGQGVVRSQQCEPTEAMLNVALAAQAPENHALDTTTDLLLDVARLAHDAMDGTEENDTGLHWNREDFDALSEAMDKLDALPDNRPGYVMGPAAKAAWELKASFVRVAAVAAQAPVQGEPGELTNAQITDLADDNDCGRTAKGYRLFSDRNLIAFTLAAIDAARKAAKP